jgi:hypothetical protein
MSFLNANIPPIECYVRGNFLRNQEDLLLNQMNL